MNILFLMKVFQVILVIIFTVSISDFSRRKDKIPLINKKLIQILELFYFVPLFIYAYVILNSDTILYFDIFACIFALVGIGLVVKAKLDLGTQHVWIGYCLLNTKLVTKGIYAWIRHPLYTGIYVFIIGGLMFVVPRAPFLLTVVALTLVTYILIFIIFVARKETQYLTEKLGDEFLKYKNQVHPFLPIKRFKNL